MTAARGFGVAGALDHGIVAEIAAAAETAGYASFWANDTPGGDGLAALAAAARVTDRIELGVGVIPIDRTPATEIARRVKQLGLPPDRTVVGVGSGGIRVGAVAMVEEAVTALRRDAGVRVFVGALGPRMCAMGGRSANGLLLNWLTPAAANEAVAVARDAAEEARQPEPSIAAYVRVALPDGRARLRIEADRYASFPQYAAHFERMGIDAYDTTVSGAREEILGGLGEFDGAVDEVIIRAITAVETSRAYLDLLHASAPAATE